MVMKLTLDGVTDTLEGWSRRLNLPLAVIRRRVKERSRVKNPDDVCRILAPLRWDRSLYEESDARARLRKSLDDASSHERTTRFVNAQKDAPCMDCGGRFPACAMDFDHRDQGTKSFAISSARGRSLAAIGAEIAKCDLVCANCHRVRTWKSRGSMFRRGILGASDVDVVHRQPAPPAEDLPPRRVPHLRLMALALAAHVVREEMPDGRDGSEQERIDLALRIALRKEVAQPDRSLGLRLSMGLPQGKLCPANGTPTTFRQLTTIWGCA